jgi:hypothetical protein
MKTSRVFILIGLLLLMACAGGAAWLDRSWFMGWRGNRAADFSPLRLAIGEGQKMFAGQFYRKADVYFHGGMYPSIFDNNESFKTAHIGEDAGATASSNTGDEENFLGKDRDIIDRFSRNFFPTHHTHLDQGGAGGHSHGGAEHHHGPDGAVIELGDGTSGEVREILPWLKVAQELDPENPLTYSVTAYWLRSRMHKSREAELLLREGLEHLPNHPVLLFELGRIYYQPFPSEQEVARRDGNDLARARNLWISAASAWWQQEANQPEPDVFILEQILTHLGKLEEDAGDLPRALSYWEQARDIVPERDGIPQRIAELRAKLTK